MQLTRTPALRRLRHRLRSDQSGLALVEFAIVAPVLLTLGLGGVEVAAFAVANLRVSEIAMTVADNAGRVRVSIDETDINELMIGAKLIGEGIKFAENGRIILSDLEQRTSTKGGKGPTTTENPKGYLQWIRWQRCAGAMNVTSSFGGPITDGGAAVTDLDSKVNADHGADEVKSTLDGMGPDDNKIAASTGTAVMFAEVVYDYQPVVPFDIIGPRTIRVNQAFNVRQRTDFVLKNDGKLSGNARSDCRLFLATVPVV